jgi:hypothetical protein
MAHINTKHNVGDKVWWVHCSGRVYGGTIKDITCCDYQGFLYCLIESPTFKVNPFPVVHYSNVFKTKEEAKKYAKYQKRNPDDVVPMCMSCHYNDFLKQREKIEPTANADRIRAWNDHELAETIANFVSEIDNGDVRYSDDPNDWLKWLQQPVEVDNG